MTLRVRSLFIGRSSQRRARTGSHVALLISLCLTAFEAHACRCAQRTLADYYHAADQVFVARVVGNEADANERQLTLNRIGPLYKGMSKELSYRSGKDSASCGIATKSGTLLLVFAQHDPGQPAIAHIDSCNGTRPFSPNAAADTQTFIDVPKRHVIPQLLALQGAQQLARLTADHPNPANPTNDSLIGLLDLAPLAHGGRIGLYREPDPDQPVLAWVDDATALETKEVGYETPAAVVYSALTDWYRLRLLDGRFVWLHRQDAGAYWPYDKLPVRRLAYLNEHWDGFVWPSPGAGQPFVSRDKTTSPGAKHRQQYAVEVLESTRIGGSLWFRVNILRTSPCDGPEPKSSGGGWVPGYGPSGEPTVWFHSRGC